MYVDEDVQEAGSSDEQQMEDQQIMGGQTSSSGELRNKQQP
jgi:hypothetical protein